MFHGKHDGETIQVPPMSATAFDVGCLVGLLVGEGHFGGDGRQAHVTLRMHTDHESLFQWLQRTFPGGKLYGPYHHGGRSYYQWMARGAFLREVIVPILERHLTPDLDHRAHSRYLSMKERYGLGSMGSEARSSNPAPGDENV
jgi:hypothetical protein